MDKNIGQEIAEQIIQESAKIISLYPGSFSPPHRGHFGVVEKASQHVDELHIIISNNIREGYTPELSLKIWEQYKKLLPKNVKVYISKSPTPVTEVYNIVKDKTNNYLVIYGKGEQDRYNSINENREKYSNVDIIDAGNNNNISATQLREAIRTRNRLAIKSLIPEGIKVDDFLMNFQIHEIKINKPGITVDSFKNLAISKTPSEIIGMWANYGWDNMMGMSEFFNSLNPIQQAEVYNLMSKMENWKKNLDEKIDYKKALVDMAKRKDPDRLTSLGKDYLPDPQLEEAKNLGELYHFTNLKNIVDILYNNKLTTSKSSASPHQRDFQFLSKEKQKSHTGKSINFISLTRDKLLYKKDPKIQGSLIRIELDGNKLSNKYKIKPFNYYSDEIDNEHDRFKSNEGEERIDMGDQNEIPNITSYINKISILLDKIGDNETYLKQAEYLFQKYPNLITVLYKEKPITIEEYKQDILPNLNFDELDEIKVNKPNELNFPIYLDNQEDAIEIGKKLFKLNYYWLNNQKPDWTNSPFKTNNFESFKIFLTSGDKVIDYEYINEEEPIDESKLLKEVFQKEHAPILDKAVKYMCEYLDIPRPNIILINNPNYTKEHSSFGGYSPSDKKIYIVTNNRNLADITRSMFHEGVHLKQDLKGTLTAESGKDGDEWENEANSTAGTMMRKFSRENPEIFE